MNIEIRQRAIDKNMPLMDYILKQIKNIEAETGEKKTIFAACPNSLSVIKASLRSAKRNNAPIKFAATLNQVDADRGYTGLNQKEFVQTIREQARVINYTGPVIVAVDHGGPWLKDIQKTENWSLEKAMNWVKKSFEDSVAAGYDLIHVDPTVDATLPKGEVIDIDVVVERTIELIVHTEKYRRANGFNRIAYEVGTEEVHGGLADMATFNRFLTGLKSGLKKHNLTDIWPCFVVGKVGTDLHTTLFDPEVAKQLTEAAAPFGSVIKGHYSDSVDNPQDYPASGMGAANIGPEFTEMEYDALIELEELEKDYFKKNLVAKQSNIKEALWNAVITSNRWQKWLTSSENKVDFYANDKDRQVWLVKTGCRYIWENPEVLAARGKLMANIEMQGIDAESIIMSKIEKAMDRYFFNFNLVDLNESL